MEQHLKRLYLPGTSIKTGWHVWYLVNPHSFSEDAY